MSVVAKRKAEPAEPAIAMERKMFCRLRSGYTAEFFSCRECGVSKESSLIAPLKGLALLSGWNCCPCLRMSTPALRRQEELYHSAYESLSRGLDLDRKDPQNALLNYIQGRDRLLAALSVDLTPEEHQVALPLVEKMQKYLTFTESSISVLTNELKQLELESALPGPVAAAAPIAAAVPPKRGFFSSMFGGHGVCP